MNNLQNILNKDKSPTKISSHNLKKFLLTQNANPKSLSGNNENGNETPAEVPLERQNVGVMSSLALANISEDIEDIWYAKMQQRKPAESGQVNALSNRKPKNDI